ncbi:MAG TPA: hypothetical protein P5091_06040 [Acholeplasmataceae bacterium]|nr:hypothetical protein [Acholeplasmataceae bacterium]
MKLTSIDQYLESLDESLLWWHQKVITYMKDKYPNYPLVFFYQRPTLKLDKKLFIMMGGGKSHFSLYSTDFEYVENHKLKKLPKIKYGKSAILFPLGNREYIHETFSIIDDIVKRSRK